MKLNKIFLILLIFWILMTLYLVIILSNANRLLQLEITQKSEYYQNIEKQVDEKNEYIRNLRHIFAKTDKNDRLAVVLTVGMDYEKIRRKILADIQDLSYYVNDRIQNLKNQVSLTNVTKEVEELDYNFRDRLKVLLAEYYNFSVPLVTRKSSLKKELMKEVQERFYNLQNPKNCSEAKILICTLMKLCGFGCQFHHLVYCFIQALHMNRTLIINSKNWLYDQRGMDGYFKPVSQTCNGFEIKEAVSYNSEDSSKAQIIDFDRQYIEEHRDNREHLPLNVPNEYFDRINEFHSYPFMWWIGQIFHFLFKLDSNMHDLIYESIYKIDYQMPCVGVHVRRTDKLLVEASSHSLDEYMKYVDVYFDLIELTKPNIDDFKRNIYLATDELSVLNETLDKKYSKYNFMFSTNQETDFSKRYSPESLITIIRDVVLLSKCEYLVCTFSSNVCRMAYGMMQSRYTDASWRFKSLDDIYYFGGQNEHKMRVVYDHIPQSTDEIELKIGDVIGIAGDHWNGYSKGRNYRTYTVGLFPSYKVIDIFNDK